MANLILFIGGFDAEMLLFLIPLLVWGYAIVEIVTGAFRDSVDKVVWLLLVLMVPVFGLAFYFLVGRRRLAK
ncbi:hypothetical protein GCM10023188_07680 [Pontibacter saemangeumensis]|uniref:Cardiolipin synthase N-terminal domain-containing protein n=1 Tax=Pontibacter saemangeumensis TaxID=1084525 RepID=A0ABP8LAK9_9BACT